VQKQKCVWKKVREQEESYNLYKRVTCFCEKSCDHKANYTRRYKKCIKDEKSEKVERKEKQLIQVIN